MTSEVPEGFEELPLKSPFNHLIGPIYGYVNEGVPIMAIRMQEKHENLFGGTTHGGMISALADNALGWGLKQLNPRLEAFVTTHLSTEYLAAIRTNDWVEARVHFIKAGRRLCFAECKMVVGERVVAKASGQFMPV